MHTKLNGSSNLRQKVVKYRFVINYSSEIKLSSIPINLSIWNLYYQIISILIIGMNNLNQLATRSEMYALNNLFELNHVTGPFRKSQYYK